MSNTVEHNRVVALSKHLSVSEQEANDLLTANCYRVLTDEEANKVASEYIKQTLFCYRPEFLAGYTGIDACVFQILCMQLEEGNEAIRKLIDFTEGIDGFIDHAIESDGRGAFINHWDFSEEEEDGYFIYRQQ